MRIFVKKHGKAIENPSSKKIFLWIGIALCKSDIIHKEYDSVHAKTLTIYIIQILK